MKRMNQKLLACSALVLFLCGCTQTQTTTPAKPVEAPPLTAEVTQAVADGAIAQAAKARSDGTTQNGPVTAEGAVPSGKADGLSNFSGSLFTVLSGAFVSKEWKARAYSAFIKVSPGSRYKITASPAGNAMYYGLKNTAVPPRAGDAANLSDAEGWNSRARVVDPGETEEGIVPADVNYLYFYLGPNASLSRKPSKIEIDGIIVYNPAFADITMRANTRQDKHPEVNKTIAFFGDSCTAGSGWTGRPESQGYHQYIHDLYGFTCLNYGYGGAGYVTSNNGTGGLRGIGQPGRGVSNQSGAFSPNNVRARLAEVTPSELDGVVIFAGSNDWSHQVPLADFASELDSVFNYYQMNFGMVPLLVLTPIHRINENARTIQLHEYVDTIIQKCREHGIPYIDLFTMSGLQPNNEGNRNVFFPRDDNRSHSIDGVHPNHLAHQRIARCIGETLNQMVNWNETAVR